MEEAGKCPVCGAEELEYWEMEVADGQARYAYECKKCGFNGYEWYSLVFSNHTNRDGMILSVLKSWKGLNNETNDL